VGEVIERAVILARIEANLSSLETKITKVYELLEARLTEVNREIERTITDTTDWSYGYESGLLKERRLIITILATLNGMEPKDDVLL
jgi:hypothetical protein